jgi:hypothetical protein
MILAISQSITSGNVVDGGSSSDIDDVVDYTFDTTWASNTSDMQIRIDFVAGDDFTYVAIAGHNLGTLGASVTVRNHDVFDVSVYEPDDDRPILFIVPARSGGSSDLRLNINKPNATDVVILSHVAAGLTTDFTSVTTQGQIITRDYGAGYPRIPMNRARKSKAILNDAAGPTATLIKTISQKARLSIPDVATNFAQDELLEYQTFWTENAFFIQNDDDVTQTYMAMQFIPIAPSSHSSTRGLVNLAYSFIAYNGL